MEKNEMRERAIELQSQGYSLQQIAQQLNISKSSVHRLLKENETFQDVPEREETDWNVSGMENQSVSNPGNQNFQPKINANMNHNQRNSDPNVHYYKLQERQMELEHEREMQKLQQKEKELELERLRIQNQQNANSEQELKEKQKLERQKRLLLRKFHKLIQELIDNCEGCDWQYSELDEYSDSIQELKEEIEEFIIGKTDDDFENNRVWIALEELDDYFIDIINNRNEGDVITFNYTRENVENLETYLEIEDLCEQADSDEDQQ